VPIVDVQRLRLVYEPPRPRVDRQLDCDVLVAGGGLGGVAAALGACERGRTVVLTEETDWLGGQMSSQGVAAPDDHRYIETFGGTRLYYELRKAVRNYYADHYQLSPEAASQAALSPGRGWVSRLTFEPRAAAAVMEQLVRPHVESAKLTILRRHKPVSAETAGNRVQAVTLRDLDSEAHTRVTARYFLDATELGDLLPLTSTEYVAGAETKAETGEPTARKDQRRIDCAQSFGYPFALEYRPGERNKPIDPPARYAEFRERQPYTFAHNDGSPHPPTFQMFGPGIHAGGPFWSYRRALDRTNFSDPKVPFDVAVILFAGNDYHWGWILDQPAESMLESLREAKELAQGFAHWLQAEVPRDEGGQGYPEMRLRPDVMGSEDGFSKYPYIRESRRIVPLKRVLEQEIGARFHPEERAVLFPDAVGIGWHGVDLHPGACGQALAAQRTRPFQIPLGALIPRRVENLLAAGKAMGTTHITNGAYRMHPTEWNIGEAAGRIAAFCAENDLTPKQLHDDPRQLRRLQAYLVYWGIPIFWYVDTPQEDTAFRPTQLLATWGLWPAGPKHLRFNPDEPVTAAQAQALLRAAKVEPAAAERILAGAGLTYPEAITARRDLARAWLGEIYPAEEN
jgi:hypothetical protein